jgi:hypothetical protein
VDFYDLTIIQEILYLHQGGMPINTISVVLGVPPDTINDILDEILCYLY